MRIIIILAVILVMGTSGCAFWQKNVQDIAQMDAQNAVTTRIAARQICSTWSLNSSALSVILEKYKAMLPCDCAGDIKALDEIAAKCAVRDANGILTCEELSDVDMGKAVVLWGWIWGSITKSGVQKLMEVFFPKVLTSVMPYVTALGL